MQERDDVLGMDGAILTMEEVLQSSGHIGGFNDPMCDCLLSNSRLRADQIEPQDGTVYHFTGASIADPAWNTDKAYSVLQLPGQDEAKTRKTAREYYSKFINESVMSKKEAIKAIELQGETTEQVTATTNYNPANGSLLTEPRDFNLMLQTNFGATGEQVAYLRPETAQSIFCQYKNVLDSNRIKLPFGIAQIGKSFRNEINPRNYIFVMRFEQMEIEYFCRPEDGLRLTDEWLETRLEFYAEIGIPAKNYNIDIPDGDRDFTRIKKPTTSNTNSHSGIQELEGVAYRTDYDLGVHAKGSGRPLEYFYEETKERFLPHVVEPSAGCDRTVLALICEAFDEEELGKDGKSDLRTVMRFMPSMAPIKVATFGK